jgi:hypothetical protein
VQESHRGELRKRLKSGLRFADTALCRLDSLYEFVMATPMKRPYR